MRWNHKAAFWAATGSAFSALVFMQPFLALVPSTLWASMTVYGAMIMTQGAHLQADRFIAAVYRALPMGLLAPLIARINPVDLENQNRKKIMTYLEAHPGASIQDVRMAVDVAWGTAVYHLDRLRRSGQVVSHKQGNHHRYWRSGTPAARLRRGWAALEQQTARDIAMAVATSPGVHQGAICDALDVRAPSASKHLSRLEKQGLVEKSRVSRYTVYQPTAELEEILALQGSTHAEPPERPV